MKEGKKMKKSVLMILTLSILSLGLSACSPQTEEKDSSDKLDWESVEASYKYALPLVMVNATKEKMTNTETSTGTQAPINQLAHAKELATAKSLNVVTPNTDTIYSQAFLDHGSIAQV